MAENFLEPSYNVRHQSVLVRRAACLEELDGRTPKLVRLDNEDEGTQSLADPRDTHDGNFR